MRYDKNKAKKHGKYERKKFQANTQVRLGDRSRRVDSEGARAPKKVLEVKDRHHSKCHNSYFHSFIGDVKMLKETYHFFFNQKISVERAARVATCVWEEQIGGPCQGEHQCFQVFGLRAHIHVYVTYQYIY